jgi:hypothetical protein
MWDLKLRNLGSRSPYRDIGMSESKEVEVKARVTAKMRRRVKELAAKKGESVSLVVREAVREYLGKRGPETDQPKKK